MMAITGVSKERRAASHRLEGGGLGIVEEGDAPDLAELLEGVRHAAETAHRLADEALATPR